MNFLPDIIFVLILIVAFIFGYKKGLVKSVWKLAALAITILLVMAFKQPAIDYAMQTDAARRVGEWVSQNVALPQGGGVNIAQNLNLPDFLQTGTVESAKTIDSAASAVNNAAASWLTGLIINIAVCILLFIVIRLLLMAAFMIVNTISKAPLINGANKFLGGVLAVVNIIFIVFLALAMFTMFAPADSGLYDVINKSYLVKYLYNYNILLQIFMKV